MARNVGKLLGMSSPRAPEISQETVNLQREQAEMLRRQRETLDRQEVEQRTQTDALAATQADQTAGRARRARGRVSLLNNDVGILLPAGPEDLKRRLGA